MGYNRCFYRSSSDDGLSFSKPVEITNVFNAFKSQYDWNVLATGPCHAIQLKSGVLVVPVWLSTGGHAHHPSCVSTIYSDDHGKTWKAGEIAIKNTAETVNPNETVAVELSDGRVMLNARNESKAYRRITVTSADGHSNWSPARFDPALTEAVCNGSILQLPASSDGRSRMLFCNPANFEESPKDHVWSGVRWRVRKNLTVRLSYDDGQT